jgi:hypothetical protein
MSDSNVIPLFLVPRGGQPRPHVRLSLEEVKAFRFLECPSYSGCLNFAAHLNWAGFHCTRCAAYQKHNEAEQLISIGHVQKQP